MSGKELEVLVETLKTLGEGVSLDFERINSLVKHHQYEELGELLINLGQRIKDNSIVFNKDNFIGNIKELTENQSLKKREQVDTFSSSAVISSCVGSGSFFSRLFLDSLPFDESCQDRRKSYEKTNDHPENLDVKETRYRLLDVKSQVALLHSELNQIQVKSIDANFPPSELPDDGLSQGICNLVGKGFTRLARDSFTTDIKEAQGKAIELYKAHMETFRRANTLLKGKGCKTVSFKNIGIYEQEFSPDSSLDNHNWGDEIEERINQIHKFLTQLSDRACLQFEMLKEYEL